MAANATPEQQTRTLPSPAPPQTKPEQPRWWNVVLLNDEDHSYEYVIRMLGSVFGHSKERAFKVARTVDSQGRAVCLTTHKEHAELKREQIHGFGRDHAIAACKGSMSSVIEPAMGEHDDLGGDGPDGAAGGGRGAGGGKGGGGGTSP